MLTRWLTFTAFLAVRANPGRGATGQGTLTVAPTCRVKGHPEVELTLHCGDGKDLGELRLHLTLCSLKANADFC